MDVVSTWILSFLLFFLRSCKNATQWYCFDICYRQPEFGLQAAESAAYLPANLIGVAMGLQRGDHHWKGRVEGIQAALTAGELGDGSGKLVMLEKESPAAQVGVASLSSDIDGPLGRRPRPGSPWPASLEYLVAPISNFGVGSKHCDTVHEER